MKETVNSKPDKYNIQEISMLSGVVVFFAVGNVIARWLPFQGITVLEQTFWKCLFASLFLILLVRFDKPCWRTLKRMAIKRVLKLVIVGLLVSIFGFLFMTIGLAELAVSKSNFLLGLQPLFTVLFGLLLYKGEREKVLTGNTAKKLIRVGLLLTGIIACIFGTAFLFTRGKLSELPLLTLSVSEVFIVISNITYGLLWSNSRKLMRITLGKSPSSSNEKRIGNTIVTLVLFATYSIVYFGVLLINPSLGAIRFLDPVVIFWMVIAGVISLAFGSVLYFGTLSEETTKPGIASELQYPFSALLGALLWILGVAPFATEEWSAGQAIGGAIIVVGVLLVLMVKRDKK